MLGLPGLALQTHLFLGEEGSLPPLEITRLSSSTEKLLLFHFISLLERVSPSEPQFYTFTYFNFAVSCTERLSAVDDTRESQRGGQLHVFNRLFASTKMLPESRGISFER